LVPPPPDIAFVLLGAQRPPFCLLRLAFGSRQCPAPHLNWWLKCLCPAGRNFFSPLWKRFGWPRFPCSVSRLPPASRFLRCPWHFAGCLLRGFPAGVAPILPPPPPRPVLPPPQTALFLKRLFLCQASLSSFFQLWPPSFASWFGHPPSPQTLAASLYAPI